MQFFLSIVLATIGVSLIISGANNSTAILLGTVLGPDSNILPDISKGGGK